MFRKKIIQEQNSAVWVSVAFLLHLQDWVMNSANSQGDMANKQTQTTGVSSFKLQQDSEGKLHLYSVCSKHASKP
jgi:hypothetical protein